MFQHGKSNMSTERRAKRQSMQCNSSNEQKVLSLEDFQRERDCINAILPIGKKHGIHEILPITTKEICVADWVQMKCKYGCKKFGKSWCCPPETPTPEQARILLQEYKKALLLCGSIKSTSRSSSRNEPQGSSRRWRTANVSKRE